MRNYRDKFDIIADILQITKKNPKKTQIMYQANLSYKLLQRYLEEIMASSLINFENKYYTLTKKGQNFLEIYSIYSETNKYLKKKLNEINETKKILETLCSNDN